jgi:hypothetical protein
MVDFFKNKLFRNVFHNSLMRITTIENPSGIQLELDATITGDESNFHPPQLCQNHQHQADAAFFVLILNNMNSELMLTESHFDINGELHQFFIQLIISVKIVQ